MITSASNGRIKEIVNLIQKAKVRREKKVFIIEGIRLFSEVPRELIEEIYVSDTFLEKQENRELLEGLKYETVKEEVFRKISDTKTPQGILAVVKQPQYSLEQMILQDLIEKPSEHAKQPLLVILEDIQDPGNLGTIMRTAEGAGVTGVIMTKETVDVYNPKNCEGKSGYLPEERAWLDELEKAGFIDTFRMFDDGENNFTWWSYRTKARDRNAGWRLDYFYVNEEMKSNVKSAEILSEVYGSDHCPVTLELDF